MLMEENRKHILDRFLEYVEQNFSAYCERHGIPKTENQLVSFLIDLDLIPSVLIKRYAVLNEFERILPEQAGHKTLAVNTLADRFNISERTVWNILKQNGPGKKPPGRVKAKPQKTGPAGTDIGSV